MPSGAEAALALARDPGQGGAWLHPAAFCSWVASLGTAKTKARKLSVFILYLKFCQEFLKLRLLA